MSKYGSATAATRGRILDASLTLFGRYGFRRTSMQDIAGEAGISRGTLYLQFRTKEEIFRELAAALHEVALSGAEAALERDGPLADRLRAAVEAKTVPMIEIVQASPHGSELTDEKNRLCGDLATDSERRFQEMLTRAFTRTDKREIDLAAAELSASEAADLFARALAGLKGSDTTPARYRKQLASLIKVFVRGLGG